MKALVERHPGEERSPQSEFRGYHEYSDPCQAYPRHGSLSAGMLLWQRPSCSLGQQAPVIGPRIGNPPREVRLVRLTLRRLSEING